MKAKQLDVSNPECIIWQYDQHCNLYELYTITHPDIRTLKYGTGRLVLVDKFAIPKTEF